MLQDKIKGQCDKWLKSNCEIFINILSKDINNNPNLIRISKINLNRIQERRYFNALINPILTNKELEDKYKDKIKEVNQEVDYLRNVQEVYINPLLLFVLFIARFGPFSRSIQAYTVYLHEKSLLGENLSLTSQLVLRALPSPSLFTFIVYLPFILYF